MRKSFEVISQRGGNDVTDGYVVLDGWDTLEAAARRRVERQSGLKVVSCQNDGYELRNGVVARVDFRMTLGTKCRDGGWTPEGSIVVGIEP